MRHADGHLPDVLDCGHRSYWEIWLRFARHWEVAYIDALSALYRITKSPLLRGPYGKIASAMATMQSSVALPVFSRIVQAINAIVKSPEDGPRGARRDQSKRRSLRAIRNNPDHSPVRRRTALVTLV